MRIKGEAVFLREAHARKKMEPRVLFLRPLPAVPKAEKMQVVTAVSNECTMDKQGMDWSSPSTLVTLILAILLGLLFLFIVLKLRGKFP